MKIEGNRITYSKKLEVKFSANVIEENEEQVTLEGVDEDSYLKIYSPFRGIARLLLFENGKWFDAESGVSQFDYSALGLGEPPDLDSLDENEEQAEDRKKTETSVSELGLGEPPDLDNLDENEEQAEDRKKTETSVSDSEEVVLASEKVKKQKFSSKE